MAMIGDDARDRVRPPKTAELIARYLRSRIIRGDLAPDAALPGETQLMAQFGVSRPTLREAFRILEAESLITVRRGARGGPRVLTLDATVAARSVGALLQVRGTTIVDVYEARMLLEPPCAGMLAKRRTVKDLSEMRDRIAHLETLLDSPTRPDPAQWSNLTYGFHELLLQRSGNNTIAILGGVLAEVVRKHVAMSVTRNIDDASAVSQFRRMIRSYEKLVRLVEERDSDAAEAHWRAHMEVAARSLLGNDLKTKPVVDLFD